MEYHTLDHRAEDRFVEKKSEFIGNAAPVRNEEEALAFLNEVRRKYPDARLLFVAGGDKIAPIARWHRIREFLERCEREGRAVWLGEDLPRSFVLTGGFRKTHAGLPLYYNPS